MYVAITGTPGTGKTSLAENLHSSGYSTVSVKELALELDCSMADADGDEMVIDVSSLAAKLHGHLAGMGDPLFIEGHLSHFLPVDAVIVLRTSPLVLKERLAERGYGEEKLRENLEAEGVGVCLSEAVETGLPVAELDTTILSVDETAKLTLRLVDSLRAGEELDAHKPGNIDWMEEVSQWY